MSRSLSSSLDVHRLAEGFDHSLGLTLPGRGMEGQSGAPRLMGFDLLDRPEKYFGQMDGADQEHNRQHYG
jgi:hypothetical protein